MTNSPSVPPARGRFVVLDGLDGCGKTTQASRLVAALAGRGGPPPLHLREPGSTALGERLRELLLARGETLGPAVEALLFAAARRQMLDELVEPALAIGRDVVCERFHPSTLAYQAHAGGLPMDEVEALLQRWAGRPEPDVCLVLDVDPALAARRRGPAGDRIEDRGPEFQRAVREGFRRAAERLPRVRLVDAGGTPDEVAQLVLREVEDALRAPCRRG